MDARRAQLALDRQGLEPQFLRVLFHFLLVPMRLNQFIEGAAAVVLVFVMMTRDVKSVLIDFE